MPRKIQVDLAYEQARTAWSDLRLLAEVALLIAGKRLRADSTLLTPAADEAKFNSREVVPGAD